MRQQRLARADVLAGKSEPAASRRGESVATARWSGLQSAGELQAVDEVSILHLVLIRRETPDDRHVVFDLHDAAFDHDPGRPAMEATLVDDLRDAGDIVAGLSLVAEVDGQVVGHVLGSRAHLGEWPSLALAPLAVLPDSQGRGVGSALMHAVLAAADALEYPEAVLLGESAYYTRFGFVAAQPLGVTPPDSTWDRHFHVRLLSGWHAGRTGPFRYAAAFGIK